jgi:hypothetical protein
MNEKSLIGLVFIAAKNKGRKAKHTELYVFKI